MRKMNDYGMNTPSYPIYNGNNNMMPSQNPMMPGMNMPGMNMPNMPYGDNEQMRNIMQRLDVLEKRINALENGNKSMPANSNYNDSNFYMV